MSEADIPDSTQQSEEAVNVSASSPQSEVGSAVNALVASIFDENIPPPTFEEMMALGGLFEGAQPAGAPIDVNVFPDFITGYLYSHNQNAAAPEEAEEEINEPTGNQQVGQIRSAEWVIVMLVGNDGMTVVSVGNGW